MSAKQNLSDIVDSFPIGTRVNVRYMDGDSFDKNFTGYVTGHIEYCRQEEVYVIVKDEDTGNECVCSVTQISYNSDILD